MTEPFRFSNGQQANNVEDLIKICQESPQEGINYLNRGDLENWLMYIGEANFAQKAKQAREASVSDAEKLSQFLASYQVKQDSETSATPTSPPEPPKTTPPKPSAQPTPTSQTKPNKPPSTPKSEPTNPIVKWLQNLFK